LLPSGVYHPAGSVCVPAAALASASAFAFASASFLALASAFGRFSAAISSGVVAALRSAGRSLPQFGLGNGSITRHGNSVPHFYLALAALYGIDHRVLHACSPANPGLVEVVQRYSTHDLSGVGLDRLAAKLVRSGIRPQATAHRASDTSSSSALIGSSLPPMLSRLSGRHPHNPTHRQIRPR